ncbi:conserved hypothetical protein [Pediculus humanus corporis]|uniref:Uncharacterized protein n=1 Tax=Pediculus humanus subsp. corporis TaxID=121224 RepID=E0VJC4_PEDHC|nr:uncharacterized protein Phum_PHUM242840 [Pediculus humanus corporis]EEB13480.1 conserved hypothetical protein [Pediculus humanus corporis]
MLPSRKLFYCRLNLFKHLKFVAAYSRKSDSKNQGPYKIVKSNDVIDDVVDNRFGSIPNWELLAPKGYRFLLPGSLGPAWHEAGSMVPVDTFNTSKTNSKLTKLDLDALECTAQECPILLRNGVLELFPNNEIYTSQQLTVVTIKHKNNFYKSKSSDVESEYDAKTFVWAAQEICIKLKSTGYWADFINPFSGRPYLSPFYKSTLYETDERFRCLGFEIRKSGNCKIIQSRDDDKQFIAYSQMLRQIQCSFMKC